ncbi:hypothetical protein V8C35DRAFT_290466 [Trichoderma chlorosporum]
MDPRVSQNRSNPKLQKNQTCAYSYSLQKFMAPMAAFAMASLLFVYTRSSIRTARRESGRR